MQPPTILLCLAPLHNYQRADDRLMAITNCPRGSWTQRNAFNPSTTAFPIQSDSGPAGAIATVCGQSPTTALCRDVIYKTGST